MTLTIVNLCASNFHSQLKEGLNSVKRDVGLVSQKVHSQPSAAAAGQLGGCPTVNCVSTTWFLVMGLLQVGILAAYAFYKSRAETQAKKFY
jgi:hypothetical protein